MPSGASYNARAPRSHRTALGELLAIWGALPRTVRRYASDFAAVFAEEGREVPNRLAWIAIPATIAGILIIAAWLLLCVATASWIAATYDWRWEMALYLVALVNGMLAVAALAAAYRSLKAPLFPFTTYEFQRRLRGDGAVLSGERVSAEPPHPAGAGPRERALMRSEAELEARLYEARQATPRLLTTPSVIAAVAGAGLFLGLITAKRRPRTTVAAARGAAGVPVTRQLLNVALSQLSGLAVAAALRELQRRAGHGRTGF